MTLIHFYCAELEMNKYVGSSLNHFLAEENLLVKNELVAIKRIFFCTSRTSHAR